MVLAAAARVMLLVVACLTSYSQPPRNACADASSGPAEVWDVMEACGMKEDERVPSAQV